MAGYFLRPVHPSGGMHLAGGRGFPTAPSGPAAGPPGNIYLDPCWCLNFLVPLFFGSHVTPPQVLKKKSSPGKLASFLVPALLPRTLALTTVLAAKYSRTGGIGI